MSSTAHAADGSSTKLAAAARIVARRENRLVKSSASRQGDARASGDSNSPAVRDRAPHVRARLPLVAGTSNFSRVCTLILGIDVVAPGTVVLGANRDEESTRPSDAPAVLSTTPPLAGGRDRVAGGTWLAVRGREAAIAILNRRGDSAPPTRSRGLLALDVAREPDPAVAFEHLVRERYAPFTLVVARRQRSWILAWDGGHARMTEPAPGWHVLTHADVDDPGEPRTAWLLASLADFHPSSREAAEAGLIARLSRHEDPEVCLHRGRVVTVSSALVWLAPETAHYRHAEGRPCVAPFVDFTSLLADVPDSREKA